MKIELQTLKEVLEEKENRVENRLDEIDEYSNYYHYEVGRLSALREVESLVKDLLDDYKNYEFIPNGYISLLL